LFAKERQDKERREEKGETDGKESEAQEESGA